MWGGNDLFDWQIIQEAKEGTQNRNQEAGAEAETSEEQSIA